MTDRPPIPEEAPPIQPIPNHVILHEHQPINELQHNLIFPININRNNFPNANNLHNILYNTNFNRLLLIIKDRIEIANLTNLNYIRLLNIDFINFSQILIDNLKIYLIEYGYQIILIEDINNNNIGLKIKW